MMEETDKKDLAPEALRGHCPANTSLPGSLASRTERLNSCSSDSTVFKYLCMDAAEINTGISSDAPGATATGNQSLINEPNSKASSS